MELKIFNAIKDFADKKTVRLHMPGHKGESVLGVEYLDITEIDGADVLYSDEITLDGDLKHLIQFHFKINYAPDFLRGVNYITHFLVVYKQATQYMLVNTKLALIV